MRILSIGEFDPAGVSWEHRRALRDLGIDYRMAVEQCYWKRSGADWVWGIRGDAMELLAFAASADVLQFHPGIGQPWSYSTKSMPLLDADTVPWPEMPGWPRTLWTEVNPRARRVYYIHGSENTSTNIEAYAERYRGQVVWASTIDYATWLKAPLAPAIVPEMTPVAPRGVDDPLIIAHAPSAPRLCSTEDFFKVCRQVGVNTQYIHAIDHAEALELKRRGHAGFDHLRGCFSVNTLEYAALGMVPLVGINPDFLPALEDLPSPPVGIQNLNDLREMIKFLRDDPVMTAAVQKAAFNWSKAWREAATARLKRMYEGL